MAWISTYGTPYILHIVILYIYSTSWNVVYVKYLTLDIPDEYFLRYST